MSKPITEKNIENAKMSKLKEYAKRLGVTVKAKEKEDEVRKSLTNKVQENVKEIEKIVKKIKSGKGSKSQKARELIDAGIDSPTIISQALKMHYSHVVTVKRAYRDKSKSAKAGKTSA